MHKLSSDYIQLSDAIFVALIGLLAKTLARPRSICLHSARALGVIPAHNTGF